MVAIIGLLLIRVLETSMILAQNKILYKNGILITCKDYGTNFNKDF